MLQENHRRRGIRTAAQLLDRHALTDSPADLPLNLVGANIVLQPLYHPAALTGQHDANCANRATVF